MHNQAKNMRFIRVHDPFELQKVIQGLAFKYFEILNVTQRADQRVLIFMNVYARENI